MTSWLFSKNINKTPKSEFLNEILKYPSMKTKLEVFFRLDLYHSHLLKEKKGELS